MTGVEAQPAAVALYQRLLAAYGAGTRNALADVVASDVVYHIHGRSAISGLYRGVDGMLQWIGLANEIAKGTARYSPAVILADANKLMTYGTVSAKKLDEQYEFGHIYYLRWKDSLLTEGHTFPADCASFEDYWSG